MGQVCRSPRYRPECSCIKLLQFPKNRTIHPNRVLCMEQTASHTGVVNANSLSQAQTTAVQDLCQTVTVGHRCFNPVHTTLLLEGPIGGNHP